MVSPDLGLSILVSRFQALGTTSAKCAEDDASTYLEYPSSPFVFPVPFSDLPCSELDYQ